MIAIERQFLVVSNEFINQAFRKKRIVQAYLNSNPERTVRVRIKGTQGFITVKGKSNASGTTRVEWEKEIPLEEAETLLNLCEKGIIDKISNKLSKDIYCIYYEYESDFNAPYSVMLGCRVESLINIPTGLVGLKIPRTKYLRFDSYGELPDCLIKTWSEIWNSEIDRRYSFDFDVYPEYPTDSAQVQTFVSVN